ncbi:MAG: hypothetical protein E7294_08125 [Lachnospiraceae bacterium]|nr:hypothetical protein [Lachnospiraceae bacterium]
MRNRLFGFFISVILLFGMMPATAYADMEITTDTSVNTKQIQTPKLPTGGLELPEGEPLPDNMSLNEDTFQYFSTSDGKKSLSGLDEVFQKGAGTYGRNSLSKKQKEYYDKLEDAAAKFMTSDTDVEGSEDSYICSEGIDFSLMGLSQEDAVQAYVAFGYDHPAYYWLHGYSYTSRKIFFRTREQYKEATVRKAINQQIVSAVKRYAKAMQKGKTDFEKALILHDELAEAADYAYVEGTKDPVAENWAHSVIGIVDEEYSRVVCEGFAKTFSLILNYMDIPNVYIVGNAGGGGHAWNAVSYDNGETYAYVDLTWDDSNDWYYYMGMPKSDFEQKHTAFASSGEGYRWLYDLPETITDDLEGTYYYRAGKYADADTDVNSFLDAAQTDVLRFGRNLSVISDNENIRRQIGDRIGKNSYYQVQYLGKTYYCTGKKLRDTRYASPVSDFLFEKDAQVAEMESGKEQLYLISMSAITPEGSDDYFFWKSSDPEIVRVETPHMAAGGEEAVTLRLLKFGETILTATSSDQRIRRNLRLTVAPVSVKGVSLTQTKLTLEKGEQAGLTAIITPANAADKTIFWKSGDEKLVTVSDNSLMSGTGLVTALEVGKTVVTVRTKDGDHTASCEVTVKPVSVKGIRLDQKTLSLEAGEEAAVTAQALPQNAANQTILWRSEDENIVTVSANGIVTAVAAGQTNVTAITEDGDYRETCEVTVRPVSVKGIRLDTTELTLEKGSTGSLTAFISPANAADREVFFSSDDENIATVSGNGTVTALSGGTTSVRAMTRDGGFCATCKVTVSPGQYPLNVSVYKDHEKWTTPDVFTITLKSTDDPLREYANGATVPEGIYEILINGEKSEKTIRVQDEAVQIEWYYYTVIFRNGPDGEILQTEILPEKTVPSYHGEIPVKDNTENCQYQFTGWNEPLTQLTGPTEYYAEFKEIPVKQENSQKEEKETGHKKTDNDRETKQPAAVGTIISFGNLVYQVTDNASDLPQVSVRQTSAPAVYKITIPARVMIGGITYQVSSIADNAFRGKKELTNVTIPATVTVIGKNAFNGCSSLKKVTIPAGVKEIRANAFKGNKSLRKITIVSGRLKKIGRNALKGIYKKAVIKVPKKRKKAYLKLLKKKGQASTVRIK